MSRSVLPIAVAAALVAGVCWLLLVGAVLATVLLPPDPHPVDDAATGAATGSATGAAPSATAAGGTDVPSATPAAETRAAENGAEDRATPVPPVDWPELPALDGVTPLATTEAFAVHAEDPDDRWLAAQALRWVPELDRLLAEDERRSGLSLGRGTVHVVFARAYDARCPARGLASPGAEPPVIMVYLRPDTSDEQVRGVLAHEIAHHLTATGDFVGDGILTEGLANWIAGEHMLRWAGAPSWDAIVVAHLMRGSYVSLTDGDALSPSVHEDCLERRDRVYAIRTSFVGWMIDRWGFDRVSAMPFREVRPEGSTDPEERVRLPDYEAATGHDLETLERLWLRDLLRSRSVGSLFVRFEPREAGAPATEVAGG